MSDPERSSPPPIAFLAPLPPEPSGVADSSASLLPRLAERFAVTAFTRDPERSAAATRCGLRLLRYRDASTAVPGIAVYQIGNHARHHGEIYRLALARPGIAVLHEHVVHDLVRDCAYASGGARAFAAELQYCLGPTGERLAARLRAGGERLAPHDWPLFERLVDRSLAVIVHSRAARDRIARSRPSARVRVVPLLLAPPGDAAARGAELRRELAIPERALVVGAFGVAAATKRLDVALRSFERAFRRREDVFFLVAGPGSPRFVRERCSPSPDVEARLRLLDRVPLATLEAAMAATDVALNLRFPTGGETSDTCLRLLGLGCAVVVSNAGWFAEIPDDCCAKVRPDALEEPMLDALLGALAARPELRRALGENGRRWALAEHAPERVVDGYAQVIAEVAAARQEPPRRPPALTAPHADDVDAELLGEMAAALGDLGVTEIDGDVLDGVARLALGLGIRPRVRGAAAAPPRRREAGPGSA